MHIPVLDGQNFQSIRHLDASRRYNSQYSEGRVTKIVTFTILPVFISAYISNFCLEVGSFHLLFVIVVWSCPMNVDG